MATPESVKTCRARLAALGRHRAPGDPAITEASRDLKAAVAEEFIRRLVEEAPPLTEVQRNRLASLLAPVSPAPTSPPARGDRGPSGPPPAPRERRRP